MKVAAALCFGTVMALTATASAQIEPFSSGNVVKIGVLTDMSGLYADIGGPGSMHYLAAIKATGTTDGPTVMRQMKATPINDFMTKNGKIRADGTLVRDMYLYEVKNPSESRGPWDYYKQIAVIPREQAFKPLGSQRMLQVEIAQ